MSAPMEEGYSFHRCDSTFHTAFSLGRGADKDGSFCGVVIESRSRFPVAPFVGADGMEASEFATLFAAVFPDFLFALRAVGLDGLRYEVLSVRGLQQVGQPRQSAGMV